MQFPTNGNREWIHAVLETFFPGRKAETPAVQEERVSLETETKDGNA